MAKSSKAFSKVALVLYSSDKNVQQHWQQQLETVQINTSKQQKAVVLFHLTDTAGLQLPALKKLIEQGSKVLVLVDTLQVEQGVQLFRQGVKGYLETFTPTALLLRAVDQVEQGRVWLGQDIMAALIQQVNTSDEDPATLEERLLNANFTPREMEVAKGVLAGESNKTIAETLFISERTVKAHVHALLRKKQVKDRLAFVIKIKKER